VVQNTQQKLFPNFLDRWFQTKFGSGYANRRFEGRVSALFYLKKSLLSLKHALMKTSNAESTTFSHGDVNEQLV
jgi:hypothetical protein